MNRQIIRVFLFKLLILSGCPLFVLPSVVSAGETDQITQLRTLFTTPLERKKLDELRNAGQFDNKQNQQTGAPVIRAPLKVEVKGVVFRDKQKPVVWVNEGNTLKSQTIEDGIRVRTSGVNKNRLKVPVKVFQKNLSMKPGQQWTEADRIIQDKYQIKRPEIETNETVIKEESMENKKDISPVK
ncbi:MAG: hypothetical protein OQL06_01985 [Gammaproteobacteria bacterium]|nr:hypothetical protein [Gammaproteobacteria bacterium]